MSNRTKKTLCKIVLLATLIVGCMSVAESFAQDAGKKAPAAPAPAAPGAKQAGPEVESESLLSLLLKGGVVMIPIGLCSVAAVAISIERFISLRRDKVNPPTFMDGLKVLFSGQVADARQAVAYCDQQQCPMGEIVKAGVRRLRQGPDAVEKAVEDAGSREVYKMKRSLRWLLAIGTIAPLLGLLGTVYGLIRAFQAAHKTGVGKAADLAKGIYEAMVTTATGLTLAIPVLIVYQILAGHIDTLVDDIDEQAIDFLEYTIDTSPVGGSVPPELPQ